MKPIEEGTLLEFCYVNWQGVESYRTAIVEQVYYGNTQYHKEDQWLLKVHDMEKEDVRVFAMCDMTNVKVYNHE